jgi:hypothetical protein
MKVYHGWVEPGEGGPGIVKVSEDGNLSKPSRALNPRFDLRNHSPDGFQWGYAGSGPAQLALALVADATGDDVLAQRTYQIFKSCIVAQWHGSWTITEEQIRDIVNGILKDY